MPVGPGVPVHQPVAVPLDRGRLVVGRLAAEQPGQRGAAAAGVVLLSGRRRDGRPAVERRRALGRGPVMMVLLHRHRNVRVLFGGDVVRAARQLRRLPASVPRVERAETDQRAGHERQQARQHRETARHNCWTHTRARAQKVVRAEFRFYWTPNTRQYGGPARAQTPFDRPDIFFRKHFLHTTGEYNFLTFRDLYTQSY